MVTFCVIMTGLLIVFVYALATLSGMTPKMLYPLLRVAQADGRIKPLVIRMNRRDRPGHATPLCQCRS